LSQIKVLCSIRILAAGWNLMFLKLGIRKIRNF